MALLLSSGGLGRLLRLTVGFRALSKQRYSENPTAHA